MKTQFFCTDSWYFAVHTQTLASLPGQCHVHFTSQFPGAKNPLEERNVFSLTVDGDQLQALISALQQAHTDLTASARLASQSALV